mmetsp:Transcript_1152/g.2117  ORF Transcript_1152/g.2117 Transcript_1152/m.2117 type:complete len:82 (+) Transcript_1152:22-267(+)
MGFNSLSVSFDKNHEGTHMKNVKGDNIYKENIKMGDVVVKDGAQTSLGFDFLNLQSVQRPPIIVQDLDGSQMRVFEGILYI